jgi:hypothetical protein
LLRKCFLALPEQVLYYCGDLALTTLPERLDRRSVLQIGASNALGLSALTASPLRADGVIGESDKDGAFPLTKPYSPDDLGATVYEALGIEPHAVVRDRLNRPVHLN